MTLSTEVFSHVIVFHDGSKKFITEEQYNLIIFTTERQKSITTTKLGMISFSAIAKIPEIKDYYDQYPEERPAYRPEWKEEPQKNLQDVMEKSVDAYTGVVKGLQESIELRKFAGESTTIAESVLSQFLQKKKATILK